MLVFGWGPIHGLGVAGAAVSMLIGQRCGRGAAGRAPAAPRRRGAAAPTPWRLHAPLPRDILRVGIPASIAR